MGSNPKFFKRSVLASSIACVVASAGVQAQQEVEEVLVTGMRASMQRAMDVKRDSAGVVDAISAEDIGKMPDANLAESLQRITGVSINRVNGEGYQVTVRGIDPSLNMVTLNGRNMPGVGQSMTNGSVGDRSSRAFDFANLASEVVNGIEVYKTGNAGVTSGGLGAVVNVKTLRPLEVGSKGTVAAKAVHDTTVERGDGAAITPELSGLYSWANDSDTFGVSIAAAYQERENTRSNSFIGQWKPETDISSVVTNEDATIVNAPTGLFNMPSDLRYVIEDNTRTRANGLLTLQYRPVENLTTTLDVLHSDYELTADRAQQSTWYNYSAITHIEFDYNAIQAPTIYQESYPGGGKDVSFALQDFTSETTTDSVGINLDWQVSDAFSLELDAHSSKGENITELAEAGLNANIVIANYADFSYDLPVMGVTIDDSDPTKGNNNGIIDGGDMSGAIGTFYNVEQTTEINQVRLNGEFAFNDDNKLNFGVESRTDKNHTLVGDGGVTGRITMGNWGGVDPDTFGSDWASFYSARDFGSAFPDYDSSTRESNFLSNGLAGDWDSIIARLEQINASGSDPSNFNSFPDGKFQPNGLYNINREIQEDVTSAFVQYSTAFEIGDSPANLVAGLRFEQTDITSTSVVKPPATLEWQSDNDWGVLLADGDPVGLEGTGSYSNVLPNLDFDIRPSEDVVVRLSYSKTMGRPGYSDMRSEVALNNLYSRTANKGDPDLDPMTSSNIDASVEWYYNDDSYFSVGYFTKKVKNFIGSALVQSDWYGITDPRVGDRFDAAIADIETKRTAGELNRDGTLWDPNNEAHQHDQMLLNEGLDPTDASTSIYGEAGDPLAIWSTTTPVNDQDAKISGFEVGLLHWFGESGFGVQANYTAVSADVGFDVTKTQGQFAMVGLSDSANIVGFYDANDVQFRLAYNWRGAFLDNRNHFNNEPSFTEQYYQLDFSLSYDVTDAITISAEGLNLTGQDSRTHGRTRTQMWSLEDLGARYNLGVRYTF